MRTTRPHANSPFLSKLPALLAALPLLVLAACGGGEVFLQDGVNPGANSGQNSTQNSDNGKTSPPCVGPTCADPNDPTKTDQGDPRCKRGYTGPGCTIQRLNSDYIDGNPKNELRAACIPAEREKTSVKGRLWVIPDNSSQYYTPYSYKFFHGQAYNPADPHLLGLGGKEVKLHLLSDKLIVLTCTDGWYAFTKQEFSSSIGNATQALIELPPPEQTDGKTCQTHNCPSLKVGDLKKKIKLLAFGGVLSSAPKSLKKEKKLYTDKLNEIASGFFEFEIENIAEPDSTTIDWTAKDGTEEYKKDGKLYKKYDLTNKIKNSDIIVLTGGIKESFLDVPFILRPEWAINSDFKNNLKNVYNNISNTLKAIHKENPDAQVILLNTFDYATFTDKFGQILIERKRAEVIADFRKLTFELYQDLARDFKNLRIVDIYGETKNYKPADLKKYASAAYDQVALTEEGHKFYAERLYEILGGWKNGSLGKTKFVGYKNDTK